jgi:hypothetical protein
LLIAEKIEDPANVAAPSQPYTSIFLAVEFAGRLANADSLHEKSRHEK